MLAVLLVVGVSPAVALSRNICVQAGVQVSVGLARGQDVRNGISCSAALYIQNKTRGMFRSPDISEPMPPISNFGFPWRVFNFVDIATGITWLDTIKKRSSFCIAYLRIFWNQWHIVEIAKYQGIPNQIARRLAIVVNADMEPDLSISPSFEATAARNRCFSSGTNQRLPNSK